MHTTTLAKTVTKPTLNDIDTLKRETGQIPEVLGKQLPFIILVEYESYKRYALRYCSAETTEGQELSLTHFTAKVICKYY